MLKINLLLICYVFLWELVIKKLRVPYNIIKWDDVLLNTLLCVCDAKAILGKYEN